AAARTLAVLLGRVQAQPLTGLKIVRAEGETPESPAAAVLDGVWNSIEAKTMWRHPATVRGALLIDLGQSRTVTSVRVWNWNEPSGGQRGWKEFEIYVSDSPAELTPVATGIVPPAPGAANTPDYGTLVPIPPTVGRYVRLQAKSTWTADSHSGLAEVQLLGF
ncbi:MAG TPA: discoidin domain-containing protein, partial [Pirellulaceae bacterium]|nr:discoidin domain-containing protein [Pirellulaceae bacterium]